MLHITLKTSFPVELCQFYTQQADVQHICFKGCAVHSGGTATQNACIHKGTSSLAVGCHGVGALSLLRPGTRLSCLWVLLHVCCTMYKQLFYYYYFIFYIYIISFWRMCLRYHWGIPCPTVYFQLPCPFLYSQEDEPVTTSWEYICWAAPRAQLCAHYWHLHKCRHCPARAMPVAGRPPAQEVSAACPQGLPTPGGGSPGTVLGWPAAGHGPAPQGPPHPSGRSQQLVQPRPSPLSGKPAPLQDLGNRNWSPCSHLALLLSHIIRPSCFQQVMQTLGKPPDIQRLSFSLLHHLGTWPPT